VNTFSIDFENKEGYDVIEVFFTLPLKIISLKKPAL
jgi:hypothetical protein